MTCLCMFILQLRFVFLSFFHVFMFYDVGLLIVRLVFYESHFIIR